jgi:transportin-1
MAEWQPDPDGISRVIELATNALLPNNYQQTINSLTEYNQIPEFNMYLCFAFAFLDEQPAQTRMMIAIILNGNVARYWKTLAPEVQQYIMITAPNMLAHPEMLLREQCATLLSVILGQTKLVGWPDLVDNLVASLDSDNASLVHGAFTTLSRLAEDHGRELCQTHPELPHQPSEVIIPKLLQLLASGREDLVEMSLKCITHLIPWKPSTLLLHIKDFFQHLFALAEAPPSLNILVTVCKTFEALVFGRVAAIKEYMNDVIQYMLTMTNSEHLSVALAAANFWSTIADAEICEETVGPHLPQVVETLLMHLRLSEDELAAMPEEDVNAADNPETTSPIVGKVTMGDAIEASYDMGMGSSELTMRYLCAHGLEDLTNVFDYQLLEVIIPLCEAGLQSPEWLDREASVLALGAVSTCFLASGLEHLPTLVPMLYGLMDDPHPLIRLSSTWTVARYSKWIIEQDDMLQPAIDGLMRRLRDRSKQVLKYALQSLAYIADHGAEQMRDYVDDLLPIYMELFANVQGALSFKVLDAIGALSESVGEALNQPHLLEMLMPPVITRWEATDDSDERILYVFDCITRIAIALGPNFSPYVHLFWDRATGIMQSHLLAAAMAKENPQLDPPNYSFLVSSLEFVSAVIDGIKATAADLITESNLVAMLAEVLNDTTPGVARAAICLVGDIATNCYPLLAPAAPTMLHVLVANIRPRITHVSLTTNALWAVKEITVRAGEAMSDFAEEIIRRCVNVLHDPNQRAQTHQNAAILLGAISNQFPQLVAVDLQNFIEIWCQVLASLEEDDDKKTSFFGLLDAIRTHPEAVLPHFNVFANSVASWALPSTSLRTAFVDIFAAYQEQLGPQQWDDLLKMVNEEDLVILQQWYL